MDKIYTSYYSSPAGLLKISVSENYLHEILFREDENVPGDDTQASMPSLMQLTINQLNEYFEGKRKQFDLPLLQKGTDFQQAVWQALMSIPFGTTISYYQLSKQLGKVKAIRAAAASNGRNKIAVIVPCHRVIGSNRTLVGYAGGLTRKRWLLEHESKHSHGLQTLF